MFNLLRLATRRTFSTAVSGATKIPSAKGAKVASQPKNNKNIILLTGLCVGIPLCAIYFYDKKERRMRYILSGTNIEITGKEFNIYFASKRKYVKLTNEKEVHNGYMFKDGENVDTIPFYPHGECNEGGIYFTELGKIDRWLDYGSTGKMKWMRDVEIPNNARVYIEHNKVKADKLVLKGRNAIWSNYEACKIIVQAKGTALRQVDPSIITTELCALAINLGGRLEDVPVSLRSADMCLLAVGKNGYNLQYVPDDMKTIEICLAAVKSSGDNLQYVPKNIMTDDMCLTAVKKSGHNLEYVPNDMKTPEMCITAVRNSYDLEHVPNDMKTTEMCVMAVNRYGFNLQFVPPNIITEEMCLTAIEQYSCNLQYVPRCMITNNMCLLVVEDEGYNLQYVPDDMKTEEICLIVMQKWSADLQYVPEHMRTFKICLQAVEMRKSNLEYVPENIKEQILWRIKPLVEERRRFV